MTIEKKIVSFKSVLVTIALTFFTCSLDKHYVYANSFESKNSNQLAILFKNLSNVESYREANVVIKEIWNFWINDTANEKNRQMLKIGINLMNPDTPINGMLIMHGTGTGKTCTAIATKSRTWEKEDYIQ